MSFTTPVDFHCCVSHVQLYSLIPCQLNLHFLHPQLVSGTQRMQQDLYGGTVTHGI
jgi:hypothetical protein